MRLNPFIQTALDLEVLDDRFDDQIDVFEFSQVVFEIADAYQRGFLRSEERRRLGLFGALESGALGTCIATLGA